MVLRLYGLVLTADGASETASEYDTKQLHYSNSYANTAEYKGGVLEVLDEFVEAALLVEVVGERSARRGHAASDLLTRAAGRRHRDVVGFPVIGAVDTATFEVSLYDVECFGDVLVGVVLLDGAVQVSQYRVLQVLVLHVASDADCQLS